MLQAVVLVTIVSCIGQDSLRSETLSIYDSDFSVSNVPSGAIILSGRWGLWDSLNSAFIQDVTSSLNSGYVDLSGPELSITLNQLNNSIYTTGTPLALAIFSDGSPDSQSLNWGGSVTNGAILTDPTWLVPIFGNNATPIDWSFHSNTVAVLGTFSFNGGSEQIGLVGTVPEPETWALLAGSLAPLLILRRHRSHV